MEHSKHYEVDQQVVNALHNVRNLDFCSVDGSKASTARIPKIAYNIQFFLKRLTISDHLLKYQNKRILSAPAAIFSDLYQETSSKGWMEGEVQLIVRPRRSREFRSHLSLIVDYLVVYPLGVCCANAAYCRSVARQSAVTTVPSHEWRVSPETGTAHLGRISCWETWRRE